MDMKSVCTVLLALATAPVFADTARVAVASNFTKTADAIAVSFSRDTGHQLSFTAGSSGKLYAQIANGAPFDVFLSADTDRAARLETDGLAHAGSRFTYALGHLVLWSAVARYRGKDCKAELQAGNFGKLAIANPQTAPYGAAAVQVLEALGLPIAKLDGRVVMGENISQTLQFTATGSADLGLLALSQVRLEDVTGETCRWEVPETLHRPIAQQAVLLSRSAKNPAAAGFLKYLSSDAARKIILAHGYTPGS